jgi:ABC-type transport system involved in cytochrome c biogenesis ATPase subunit
MEIQKGKYRIENRNLKFEVVENLNFHNNGGCYFLRGDNGLGKTSFLEKIIIPALKADKLSYLYIGQDIRTQLYTLRALLSTKGIKVADSDEVELLRLWIEHSQSASVLILDEFDKYFPDYSFIFDWSDAFIQTYIIVTHKIYNLAI